MSRLLSTSVGDPKFTVFVIEIDGPVPELLFRWLPLRLQMY
jgi:hypothetical protein